MGGGASAQAPAAQQQPNQDAYHEKRHNELASKHSNLEAQLQMHIDNLTKKFTDTLEAEGLRIENLIETRYKSCEESLTSYAQAQGKELQDLQKALSGRLDETMTRLEAVEPQMAAFQRELDQLSSSSAKTSQEIREEFKASLRTTTDALEKQAAELDARLGALLQEQAKEGKSHRLDLDETMERCQSMEDNIKSLFRKQEAARVAAEKAQQDFEAVQEAFEQKAEARQGEMQEEVRQEMIRNLDSMDEQRRHQVEHLEEVCQSIKTTEEAIRAARGVAESVHSRSMTWRLKGFHKRLAALLSQTEDVCFQSPQFTLCALPQMRLELQMGGRDGGGALDVPVPLPGAPVPVPGSCTVRLWAPAGMQMAFRITVGEGANAVAKRFEHSFRHEVSAGLPDEHGRLCLAMQNFFVLDNIWVRSSDSIQVVLDLLEFKCAPEAIGQGPEAARRPAQGAAGGEGGEAEASPGHASPEAGAAAPGRKPSFLGPPPNAFGPLGGPGLDELAFARSGTSEVLLEERVRNELQALRNRSVRRVEWRLEGIQRMLDVCKLGESVESPPFCAAGLDRIVFHFYPKGYDPSISSGVLSPCALFISGPVRTTLRGMLYVGSLSRQLEHRFRSKGDTGGRSKFGPLETQLDCTDSILIALDIHDVETDCPEVGGTLVLRDAQPGEKGGKASPARGDRSTSKVEPVPLVNCKGTLKIKREDATKTEELVRCVSLPTLNARQLHMPVIKGGRKASALA